MHWFKSRNLSGMLGILQIEFAEKCTASYVYNIDKFERVLHAPVQLRYFFDQLPEKLDYNSSIAWIDLPWNCTDRVEEFIQQCGIDLIIERLESFRSKRCITDVFLRSIDEL
jgi:hypothetical protein